MMRYTFICLCSLLFLFGCEKEKIEIPVDPGPCPEDGVLEYLFLGHTYEGQGTIDHRIESRLPGCYDQFWLGGDMCAGTTEEEAFVVYLDSIFDLDSDRTHWALGNHDIGHGNIQYITDRTKRKTYYSHHSNDLTLITMNTLLQYPDECEDLEAQFDLIKNVCDTINQSSHLVLIMHHIVWSGVSSDIMPGEFANAPASHIKFTCSPIQRFSDGIYPLLVQAQNRGVQVVCVSGDMGQEKATFEYTTDEGITFLASGITSEISWNEQFVTANQPDSVLIFEHQPASRQLDWYFLPIEKI